MSLRTFSPSPCHLAALDESLLPLIECRWPYVLRMFFDTHLLVAESRDKMVHDFMVFMMGHKENMDARYTTNKGMLPSDLVSEMKNASK
jgi:hypothetical protein